MVSVSRHYDYIHRIYINSNAFIAWNSTDKMADNIKNRTICAKTKKITVRFSEEHIAQRKR